MAGRHGDEDLISGEEGYDEGLEEVGHAGKGSRSYAFTAAASLILAAYCNRSLTGLGFLGTFFVWGFLNLGGSSSAGKRAKGLWGTVVAFALVVTCLQAVVQLLYAIGHADWAMQESVKEWLELAGFSRAEGGLDLVLVAFYLMLPLTQLLTVGILPPLLATIAALAEVGATRSHIWEGVEPLPEARSPGLLRTNSITSQGLILSWAAGYTTAGIFLSVSIVLAGLLRPALLALPYMLIFLRQVWRWSCNQRHHTFDASVLRLLQQYAGLHIVLLYLWQITRLRVSDLQTVADWLGIFRISAGTSALPSQVAELAALHILYAALGFYVPQVGPEDLPTDQSHFAVQNWFGQSQANVEGDNDAGLDAPLLSHSSKKIQEEEEEPRSVISLVLPCIAGAAVHATEAACFFPAVSAVALCCYSMVEPSVFSAVCLLISVWALVTPSRVGKHFMISMSRTFTALFTAWHLVCYTATAIGAHIAIPDILQSVGVYAFEAPPPVCLPLGAQALIVVILGGLARSKPRHHGSLRLDPRGIHEHRRQQEGLPQPLTQAVVHFPHSPDHEAGSPEGENDGNEELDAGSTFALLGLSGARLLWHAGFVGIPFALFFVGSAQYDVLHFPYLLLLVAYMVWPTLRLAPLPRAALVPYRQHLLLRAYASTHLAATYVLLVGHLPGLGHYLEPDSARTVLQILGLWQPSVHQGILPILAILLLTTVHAGVGRWLSRQLPQESQGVSFSERSPVSGVSHLLIVLWWGSACTSFGSLLIVILGYVLMLWDCPTSLLGLGYLALVALLLMFPPQRGRYEELDNHGVPLELRRSCLPRILQNGAYHKSRHSVLVMTGCSTLRWLPMTLLAIYAAADFLLQYIVPSEGIAAALGIPISALRFLQDVVGISYTATGWSLALRLMRPLVLLGVMHLYRFGFAVGTLQAQVEAEDANLAEQEQQKLHAQRGPVAFLKRFLILHSSKLVGLLVFATAMQCQSAIGWLLVVGLVLGAPLLGGPKSWTPSRQRLLHASLVVADLVAALWMIGLYAFQVEWLRELLGADSLAERTLAWVGLVSVQADASLESILRFKCLVLVAVTFKRRSIRWLWHLPEAVREAGGHGSVCCLFWPSPHAQAGEAPPSAQGWLDWWWQSALVRSVQLAIRDIARNVQSSTRRVLEAVDWSKEAPQQPAAKGGSWASLWGLPSGTQRRRSWHQLRMFGLAIQDWTERFWKDWGFEVVMGTLLLAAFFAVNVLSLAYMLFIAVGMAAPVSARRHIWRLVVLPVLGVLLIWQYAELVGRPPFLEAPQNAILGWTRNAVGKRKHKMPSHEQSIQDWLGIGSIDLASVWALFCAFAATCVQVHYDEWSKRSPLHRPSTLSRRIGRGGSSSHSTPEVVIEREVTTEDELVRPVLATNGTGTGVSRQAKRSASWSGEESAGLGEAVWKPLTYAAKKDWSWVDWMRFLFYRHSMDAVLIAVVALCTVENDVIHAAYLAIALLLFRRRDALRAEGNTLFKWLPTYNFAVMLVTLAYQAPLARLFGANWNFEDKGCNLAHVLGLYKLSTQSNHAFSLTARGSLADVVLWAITRLQTRVFASATYSTALHVVAEEQAIKAASVAHKAQEDKRMQAMAALEQSRLRRARALRVARLKAGISQSGGSYGVNAALLELQLEPDHTTQLAQIQPLQTRASSLVDLGCTTPDAAKGKEGAVHLGKEAQVPLPGNREEQSVIDSSRADGNPPPDMIQGIRAPHNIPERSSAADACAWNDKSAPTTPQKGLLAWLSGMSARLRRADKESYICYTLFVALFVTDFSLLALVLQVLLFCYALLAQPPARLFWQVVLVYTETILIAQYVYQIPTRLDCPFVTDDWQTRAEILGLHGNGLRGIPIFCVYLATLMHTYQLSRQEEPSTQMLHTLEGGELSPVAAVAGNSPRISRRGSFNVGQPATPRIERPVGDATGQVIKRWFWSFWLLVSSAFISAWEFLRRICSTAERPLHFLKIQLRTNADNKRNLATTEGRLQLKQAVQSILDHYRAHDIHVSILRRRHTRNGSLRATAVVSTTDEDYGLWDSLHGRQRDSDRAGQAERSVARQDAAQAAEPSSACWSLEHTAEMWPAERSEGQGAAVTQHPKGEIFADPVAEPSGSGQHNEGQHQGQDGGDRSRLSRRGLPDRSSSFQQRLRLTIQGSAQHRDGAISSMSAGIDQGMAQTSGITSTDAAPVGIDLSTVGPLSVQLQEVLEEGEPAMIAVLFQVFAERSSVECMGGLTSINGWPIRSLKPAKHAAQTLKRYRTDQALKTHRSNEDSGESGAQSSQPPSYSFPGGLPREESASRTYSEACPAEPGSTLSHHAADNAHAESAAQDSAAGSSNRSQPLSSTPGSAFLEGPSSHQEPEQPTPAPPSPFAIASPAASQSQAANDSAGADVSAPGPARRSGPQSAEQLFPESPQKSFLQTSGNSRAGDGPIPNIELTRFSDAASLSGSGLASFRQWAEQVSGQGVGGMSSTSWQDPGLEVLGVEWHSRIEQDWYAATIAVDVLSFVYVVLFYQAVIASARTLQDITDDRVVPADFLGVLLVLFFFMVVDRLFYTLGLHVGKAALLVSQMALVYWYCLGLFWGERTSPSAKTHLRVIMLLKSISFTFSALQLRNGYPSPASYRDGQGRHAFVFMRQPNTLGSIGYSVFAAVPFVYELRALLDWSCTATTLTLFDWLKLEDIHTSLFLVTCNRVSRERRNLGDRQPRYLKFFQGTLLFTGLLLLLWVPLIAFSSGNPTYQVPKILSFDMNATLGIDYGSSNSSDIRETMTFPIFQAGQQGTLQNWVQNADAFPGSVGDSYVPQQAKLLCLAPDSDRLWLAAPPGRKTLRHALEVRNVTLQLGWHVVRDAPLAGTHGGPECRGARAMPLAGVSRLQLADVLKGERDNATLMSAHFLNGTAIANATLPDGEGTPGLYSYLWQLRGGDCSVNTRLGAESGWLDLAVGCNISLAVSKEAERWWELQCGVLDALYEPINTTDSEWAQCSKHYDGPRLVAVLERVQGGLIGQTLSSFGIIGLYITVVLAIGRFLRLATQNMRMRIQYEDLPTTKRLITLCQDIYIARAEGELALEEELYWALINVYRSSAVMFELTKKKEN